MTTSPRCAAFVCDGTAGINLALGTWHWGPYPLMDHVDLVNVQGKGFADDNEVAHLEPRPRGGGDGPPVRRRRWGIRIAIHWSSRS